MPTPHATAIATSTHQSASTTAVTSAPSLGSAKASAPFSTVARPMGIVPMNIDTTLWPKMRRASWPNSAHRAA